MHLFELEIFKTDKNIKNFYQYEGKLATEPIIKFLKKESKNIHGILIDFGCGSKIYKSLFNNVTNYIGIDLYNSKADLIEDIKETSLPSNYADCALCNQVIEHDPEPEKVIYEIYRVLKNNGILLLTAPQMGRLHGEPNDYYRYTKYGLEYLMRKNGFEIISIETHGGFFRAIGSHLNFLIAEKFFNYRIIKFLLRHVVIRANNYIFSAMDTIIQFHKDTLGYNVIAIKRS